jgi:hypothetical protein
VVDEPDLSADKGNYLSELHFCPVSIPFQVLAEVHVLSQWVFAMPVEIFLNEPDLFIFIN